MTTQRFALGLTGINLILLLGIIGQVWPARADTPSFAVRGRTFELIDERGRTRSRLGVEPDGTVAFRLFDQNGTIRVKLGAGEDGSGLMMADEATEPGVHIVARRTGTSKKPVTTRLVLTGADGQQRVITP
jgi:hypothetical protein